jgi:ATP-dependent RNA helicase RhlE
VDELGLLRDIERLIKREIKKDIVPGFEVDPRIRAEPIVQGKRGASSQRRPSNAPHKAGGNRGQNAPRQPAARAGGRNSRDSGRRAFSY